MAIALPFLIAIILLLIEMGILFASFVSLVNATREGAMFASTYPQLADQTCGTTSPPPDDTPGCNGTHDSDPYLGSVHYWDEYRRRINDEIVVTVGEPLRGTGVVDVDTLTVDRPVVDWSCKPDPNRPSYVDPFGAGCPITVTVHYKLHTFTSDMSLPGFGRFGLPNYYQLDYTLTMPNR